MDKSAGVRHLFILAALACAPAAAQNLKPDAPTGRRPPIGSDVDRGQDAAYICGINNTMNFSKFAACVDGAIRTNRQRGAPPESFEFGLYVRALQHSHAHGVAFNDEGTLRLWRDRLTTIMKSHGFSFKDFCDAAANKCDVSKFDEQTYGHEPIGAKRPQ
jgi:hypothetical protein